MNLRTNPLRSATRPLVLLAYSVLAACSPDGPMPDMRAASATAAEQPATLAEPVVREILARSDAPPGAPDQRLSLVRYTIAPGAELAPHVHPGIQMASILSGVLSYRVLEGTVVIHRSVGADGRPSAVENIVGPAETSLNPGDAVLEDATMLHFGANQTNEPVVIVAALLTEPAAELAQVVDTTDVR